MRRRRSGAGVQQQVNAAYAAFGQQLAPLGGSITSSSSHSSDVAAMQKVASDLHQLSRQLDQIKVPKDALKTEHVQLRHEIDQYADAVANAAGQDAAGFKNQTKLFTANLASTINSINAQN
jgi:hypothetical protein